MNETEAIALLSPWIRQWRRYVGHEHYAHQVVSIRPSRWEPTGRTTSQNQTLRRISPPPRPPPPGASHLPILRTSTSLSSPFLKSTTKQSACTSQPPPLPPPLCLSLTLFYFNPPPCRKQAVPYAGGRHGRPTEHRSSAGAPGGGAKRSLDLQPLLAGLPATRVRTQYG